MTDGQWQGTQASPAAVASPVTQEEGQLLPEGGVLLTQEGRLRLPAIRGCQEWGPGNTEVGPGLDPIAVEERMGGFQHSETPMSLQVCARKSLPTTEPCHALVAVGPQQPLRVDFTVYSLQSTFTHVLKHSALLGALGWTPFSTRSSAPGGKDHGIRLPGGVLGTCSCSLNTEALRPRGLTLPAAHFRLQNLVLAQAPARSPVTPTMEEKLVGSPGGSVLFPLTF